MQIKVVIGTIAFMLTMMVLGYATLREPARLEEFTHAEVGRSIEFGAELFAGNCATCHGVNGQAKDCPGQDGCLGLPLNDPGLVCGDVSARMEAMGWIGTKAAFIQTTISSGRPGYIMPAWLNEFGGSLRPDQVKNLADYVLNFESEELCAIPVYEYAWQATYEEFSAAFPEGDAAAGADTFLAYGCNACHGLPEDDTVVAAVGPELKNVGIDGATRIDGYTAQDYIYESILNPSAFISPECPNGPCSGPPSAMTANFGLRMGGSEEMPQDMQDMITYLMSLSE